MTVNSDVNVYASQNRKSPEKLKITTTYWKPKKH